MSLTKLSLGGNNLYMTSLFPPRESFVSDIPAGDGNIEKLFLRCKVIHLSLLPEKEIVHVVIDLQQFRRQFIVFHLEKACLSVCRLLPGKSLSVSLSSSTWKKLICQLSSSTREKAYMSVCRLLPGKSLYVSLSLCRWLQLAQLAKGKKSRP